MKFAVSFSAAPNQLKSFYNSASSGLGKFSHFKEAVLVNDNFTVYIVAQYQKVPALDVCTTAV